MTLVDRKHLVVRWASRPRPDGRRFKRRHNRCPVHSHYLQVGRLEVVVWTR